MSPGQTQRRGWHCHLHPGYPGMSPGQSQGQGWHCHLTRRDRRCPQGGTQGGGARRDEDGIAIFAVSDQKDVALEVQVTNEPSDPSQPQRDGDAAHQALLVASFPPELPYAATRAEESAGLGDLGFRDPRIWGQTPRIWGQNLGSFRLRPPPTFRVGGLQFGVQTPPHSPWGFFLWGFTPPTPNPPPRTSEQPGLEPVVARARVVIELPLAVTGVAVPPRLFFGGQVLGESAVKRESQVGSAVRFEVTVRE
ncbi:ITA7 protein, partial [Loxia curvirostra]|nr:ITA7 protein [Loxia curvirostra]